MSRKGLNVIVICNDTLRADVVDHTWEDHVDLPNLDRLRAEGTTFTRAFAEALPTVPIRRGLMTGRRAYPWKYDVDDTGSWPNIMGWHAIPSELPTIAEIACQQGVMTGLVGDVYHLFKPTMNFTRGFVSYDFVRGQETDRVRSGPLSKIDLKAHMHPQETDIQRHAGFCQYLLNILDRKTEEDYFAPQVFRSASRWIDDNVEQTPFMLWIESFTPHEYWDPPKQFADAYFKEEGLVDYIYPQFFQRRFDFTEAEVKRTKALYYGYCTFMDKWIGHLMDKLDEHKLWDDTVVVVTSDHGTELRDRDQFGKNGQRLYAYNTRLNMIVRHPDKANHGKTVDALVQNQDVAPTICNWMNIETEEEFDGFDMMPLLEGKKDKVRDYVIGAWSDHVYVRDDDHNYLVNTSDPSKKTEVYDLKADPKETENVANAKPEVVSEMRGRLEELLGAPLPATYAHQARPGRAVGLPAFLEKWSGSNLGE